MKPKTDIEIAQEAAVEPIQKVATSLGIAPPDFSPYGYDKGKIRLEVLEKSSQPAGRLILVTAMTPTPAGEGKTTMTVGLGDGLRQIGKDSMIALREPSLGPVFGMKGGAAGGGYAQVVPMADINLHFTGDFHAISAATNLLAAMLDNHIYQGNELDIDAKTITWKRVVDMNDRQLRHVVDGLGGRVNGVPREDQYQITVASEVMAVLCLAKDLKDLKERLGRMVVASDRKGQPVTAKMLHAHGAMAVLLKDAVEPNLVQTLEGTPALVHGGPFANIAHGCNSLIATRMALGLAEYVVTEAGFGADLGAEKFLDIKCRMGELSPHAVVIVATLRALKHHGGVARDQLEQENSDAVEKGFDNLQRHVDVIRDTFGLPALVVLNSFPTDTAEEEKTFFALCKSRGIAAEKCTAWAEGGAGATAAAEKLVELCQQPSQLTFSYPLEGSVEDKLNHIVTRVYGGKGVELTPAARRQMKTLEDQGFGNLPVCVAKTQYSFSDDARALGAPDDFTVTVRDLQLSAGAGFIVALTGNILTMPGLPKKPAAEQITLNENDEIVGLF